MPNENATNPRSGSSSVDEKLIPPYEGRSQGRGDGNEESARTIERQLERTDAGRPGATSSPAEESPVGPDEVATGSRGAGDQSATDTTAASPHGVGESTSRRGEHVKGEEGTEPGRTDLGPRGRSQRPSGTADQRSSTGVDPQDLADDDMPDTVTGDQGG